MQALMQLAGYLLALLAAAGIVVGIETLNAGEPLVARRALSERRPPEC